jgi:hypothetical protein
MMTMPSLMSHRQANASTAKLVVIGVGGGI